ncbi:nickel transporter [Rothia sp. LK2588]|uniref:HoxN/HupN/NixA family nickel/cobalt transporter n=1 Tax=Rothia sp. LK2588 TaxID=3114369 RepID=UPI0034CD60B2
MSTSPISYYRHYVVGRSSLPLKVRVAFTFGAVALLHVLAIALLATAWTPGATPIALGMVIAAYTAGLKHSYDWDHISAIDNSTRKFVAEGSNPASVGFAFSLGHSTVVTMAGVMVVAGAQFVNGAFEEGSDTNRVLGLIGMGVSGFYLLFIGLFNSRIAYRLFRHRKVAAHEHVAADGLMTRLIKKPLSKVRKPRDIFVLGLLFGLGFDTATTIGLLLLTVSASFAGVPATALIGLPIAFTAAMTLCDTVNGLGMMKLYSSALTDRRSRDHFNLTVTLVSSVSALFISVITLGGFFNDLFELEDPLTSWLAEIDLGNAGLVLVAAFALIWGYFFLARHREEV